MKCTAGIHLHHRPDAHHGPQAELLPGTDKTYLVAYGRETKVLGFVGRAAILRPGINWPYQMWLAVDRDRNPFGQPFADRAAAVEMVCWTPR